MLYLRTKSMLFVQINVCAACEVQQTGLKEESERVLGVGEKMLQVWNYEFAVLYIKFNCAVVGNFCVWFLNMC
jgi:hypothetical protein